jgi:hypothetical protein
MTKTSSVATTRTLAFTRTFLDGASRDRTGDLLLAKQALSQLSYGPVEPESNGLLAAVSWVQSAGSVPAGE